METALYAPGVGFYTEPEAAIGPAASFYTAAHVSSLFGRTLAERIWAEYARLERSPTFTVVEVGCGDGTLTVDVVRALAEKLRLGDGIRYMLVDRSPPLRARAFERATPVAAGTGVELRVAESLSADGPFEGVVLANELLDALPCAASSSAVPGGASSGSGTQDRRPNGPSRRPRSPLPSSRPGVQRKERSPK